MKTDRNIINRLSIHSHRRSILYADAENKTDVFRLEETSWVHLVQLPTAQARSAKTCCLGPCRDGFGISAPKWYYYSWLLHRQKYLCNFLLNNCYFVLELPSICNSSISDVWEKFAYMDKFYGHSSRAVGN